MSEEVKSVTPVLEQDSLDGKVMEVFAGRAVRKDLTALMKRTANVPTYVIEYLLGMYCSTGDAEAVEEGLERIRKILTQNYVRPDESEFVKHKIADLGRYTIIDKLEARFNEFKGIYFASFANFTIGELTVSKEIVREYPKMLTGGIWAIMKLEYDNPEDDFEDPLGELMDAPRPKRGSRGPEDNPIKIASVSPIQMPNMDLDSFIEKRQLFTTEEWMDLLLRSAGYEPTVLEKRQKMHFLERMVPLVERNYNLCELGPRGTGKSHIYTEISPYAALISGGQTTTASLFGRLGASKSKATAMDRTGLVGNWDCVTFDEVAGMHFKDENAVQIMKSYMANGTYDRGRESFTADASMVFEGNINDTVHNVLKTTHLFDPFPPEFNNDSAFFDRIHCYLPGWEVPKMRSDILTGHVGLITDCLSEFCKSMRKRDYTHHLDEFFRLNSDFNTRDENGVRKTFSGLMKLLFPDERMTHDDAQMILEYAIEGRHRVKEHSRSWPASSSWTSSWATQASRLQPPLRSSASRSSLPTLSSPRASFSPATCSPSDAASTMSARSTSSRTRLCLETASSRHEGVGSTRSARESIDAAWQCFKSNGTGVAAGMHLDKKDYLLFFNDLQSKGPSDEVSLAEFVGLCSAACNRAVAASMVIPGVVRLSGSMDELKGLEDILRVAKNAGAKRILLPFSAIYDMPKISMELASSVSADYYEDGNAVAAARKALGIG